MLNVRFKSFIAARLQRCRKLLLARRLHALIVTDPADVAYLTGFSGDDSILLLAPSRRVLVTDSRFVEQARHECPRLPLYVRSGPMSQAVAHVLTRWQGRKRHPAFALEAQSATLGLYRAFRKALGRSLQTTEGLIPQLRQCKDAWEVAQITAAVRVAESALQNTLADLSLGITETALAARLDYEMACHSEGRAFPTIVAFGPHAAQPHARPGKATLRKGQPLLFDWGATVAGYRSDLTRSFVAGRIPPAFAEAYQWVLEAQLSAIEAVKPGASLTEVDAAARNVLAARQGKYLHGTGHGLGLNVHEAPALAPRMKGELQPGMVVTIEPALYRPQHWGIRIEDDVLVTAKGARVLSRLPKSLDSVALTRVK